MDSATIGLISALLVAVLTILGQIIMHKVQRKDKLIDQDVAQNKAMLEHFETIEKQLDIVGSQIENIQYETEKNTIIEARIRILRFADEILHNARHSKDHFDQTMEDITKYEHYCQAHPEFHNNKTVASIEIITKNFKERFEKNDFL